MDGGAKETNERIAVWISSLCIISLDLDYMSTSVSLLTNPIAMPSTNLIGHWKMNGDALDSSTQGNNGTETAMSYIAGRLDKAGSFNGTSSKIVMGDQTVYDFPDTQSFSVAGWMKYSTDGSIRQVITKFDSWGFKILKQTNSILRFDTSNAFGQNVNASFVDNTSDNTYHHLVAIRDVSTNQLRTYLDGVLKQTVTNTLSGSSMANTASLVIGATNGGTEFWNGQLDDVRIYNRVLTAYEIGLLYAVEVSSASVMIDG